MKKKTSKVKPVTIESLKDALNRLDEFASYATQDNDNGEAQQQEKDYNMLFDFLNGNQTINVNFSDNDAEDLMNGEEFDWMFPSDFGQQIHIHIFKGEDND